MLFEYDGKLRDGRLLNCTSHRFLACLLLLGRREEQVDEV